MPATTAATGGPTSGIVSTKVVVADGVVVTIGLLGGDHLTYNGASGIHSSNVTDASTRQLLSRLIVAEAAGWAG